jgi:SAM domain (Sterile alpha motif)
LSFLGQGHFDESFSKIVPETELLDNTAARSRADLALKGSLAGRHPPSGKRLSFEAQSPDGKQRPIPQRPSLPPPAIPTRPARSSTGSLSQQSPQRPRQMSQVSTSSTISDICMNRQDSFNTTPSPSKFSPLKNPNLAYASLPRSFGRDAIKTSPSSISDTASAGSESKQSTPEKHQEDAAGDWTSHHVQQWLVSYGLKEHIPKFGQGSIDGPKLLTLDSEALKNLGVNSPAERSFMKKKIKELRAILEQERRTVEKQKKAQEKLLKKSASSPLSPLKKKSSP